MSSEPRSVIAGLPVSSSGRKLLRLEVRNAETPIERKPPWIKTKMKLGPEYQELKALVRREGLNTVCEAAGCPNIYECWEDREATFLIGGEQCTRRCDFCQIDTGKPAELDRDEPRRVAESVQAMGLRYSTVTGVARDDLPDGGAWLYAETVRQIKALNPNTGVELLIPDFNGISDQLQTVFETRPEVLAHNVETVPRIFKRIRPAFRYGRSLAVITARLRSYRNAGRIRLKMRGTVSTLCASTSGRVSNTVCSCSGIPLKSGINSSTPVLGLSALICRTVSAYSHAPPSGLSLIHI